VVTELWRFFNCHIELPGNRALQAALRGPQPAGTGTVSETGAVHNRAAVCAAFGGGFFENLLKAQVSVNLKQFLKVELKL